MASNDRLTPWRRVRLQDEGDERGRLSIIETSPRLLDKIDRVYFIHGTLEGSVRGCHAHRALEQVLVCLAGQVRIRLDAGDRHENIVLQDPRDGLYIGPLVWRELTGFSPTTVCAVLASHRYDPDDYIHDYSTFLEERQEGIGL
ncbi:WxcM-like domain-containing protein [Auritidibacter sp. NML130574]|nr:WxcM-like domain-containing protein [Auritidibacter sp. NML130574]PXA79006.1 dTDP-6-deoxy-3,4-keto-hexulose isomerase [Auritidibacter sp. NML120779]